ncbi:uncharacterized protein CTRU02_203764 [Colletotrichum truncatum]|uniref:Uncharacterized protein n=1 Tax=Colletotrichum truncatum TaxID=5467 RepID=A0ACC3ZAA0_COLTU|nr:uncharacterized protein CTRU02_04096 [Colletotrichum truncatum]KAF6796135.1 hypothetical protein CTRU02_04096 [Colletotrichum truncatum]
MDNPKRVLVTDNEHNWELSSSASSPRSNTSSSSPVSLFSTPSTPESPANTEMSFLSPKHYDTKQPVTSSQANVISMPNHPNHIIVGQTLYTPGQIQARRDVLLQARSTGEFPSSTISAEEPQTIVEDYQHLQRLRDARGNPSNPPPEKYNLLRVDIARRIKARDEAQGGSANLQEMDNRVQSWMNSINKESRMLEITQAALQRKGISNPTQDDLDAIAEEFMQIAERTLLDVANPLRMNASRMEGNISRFDSQLNGLSGQLNGLSSINDAVNASMSAQVNTINAVMSNLNQSMSCQLSTLNTMLTAQSNTFDKSMNMLNTSLSIVTTDLQKFTADLPAIIAAATQAAVREQLSAVSYQHTPHQQAHATADAPPSYVTNMSNSTHFPGCVHDSDHTQQALKQQSRECPPHGGKTEPRSRLRRLLGKFGMK